MRGPKLVIAILLLFIASLALMAQEPTRFRIDYESYKPNDIVCVDLPRHLPGQLRQNCVTVQQLRELLDTKSVAP